MAIVLSICIFLLILILTTYYSGFFETWVVKNCTNCGEFCPKGTQAVCNLYSMGLDGQPRTPLHNIVKAGITHDHLLCSICHDAAMTISQYHGFPDLTSRDQYEKSLTVWKSRQEKKQLAISTH